MIGNQVKGRGFRGCLNYLWGKAGAEHIGGNMSGCTPQQLANEFKLSRQQNSNVQRVVYHASLSIAKHERLDNNQWSAIAEDYLKGMGFNHNQYIIVRHQDREHDHIHIVASRIRLDGTCVHDGWDYRRSETMIRQLEQAYKLESVTPSWEVERRAPTKGELKHFERTKQPGVKTKLQNLASDALSKSTTPEAYIQRLQQAGVEVKTRKERNDRISGISYQLDGVAISGTKLGRAYTWQGVQQHIQALNQCQYSLNEECSWEKEAQQSRDLRGLILPPKTESPKNRLLGLPNQASVQEAKAKQRAGQDLSIKQQILTQLHAWQKATRALQQSKDYQSQIKAIVTAFQAGEPLSPKAVVAMRRDLSAYERGIDSMQRWQHAAKELRYPKEQCQRIQRMTELYRQGYPLPELAALRCIRISVVMSSSDRSNEDRES